MFSDQSGNIVGILKGYKHDSSVLLLSHYDASRTPVPSAYEHSLVFTSETSDNQVNLLNSYNIASQIYAGALLKRCALPMEGDIVVACMTAPAEAIFSRSKVLIDCTLKENGYRPSYVLLAEPTDLNMYIGNKGLLEYKISVKMKRKGKTAADRQSLYERIIPAVNCLKSYATGLPSSNLVGKAMLDVKSVSYNNNAGPDKARTDFDIIVERKVVPGETTERICDKASDLVRTSCDTADISTRPVQDSIVRRDRTICLERSLSPWNLMSNNPFVITAGEALRNIDIAAGTGFWQETITDGSYTCGELKIPTIGYGLGQEGQTGSRAAPAMAAVSQCVLGTAAIVQSTIGFPVFGWSSDEI